MAYRAKKLDRRVQLQTSEAVTSGFGAGAGGTAWSDLAVVWAHKHDVSDRERLAADGVSSDLLSRFTIRFSRDVSELTTRDRIICGDVPFQILGVKQVGPRDRYLEITAVARSDQ